MIKLRRLFCFFGFHKYKIKGANQYGEWKNCLYCRKKYYYSYLTVSQLIGEPVDASLPQPTVKAEPTIIDYDGGISK